MINKFLDNLKKGLFNALVSLNYPTEDIEIILEVPKDKNHGDYSTNLAMKLVKILRKPPMIIAEEIVNKLDKKDLHLSKIEIANPGFINFTIDMDYLLEVVNVVNKNPDYGKLDLGKGKKIDIEFVSANPTGYLHIGHGRGAAYGDSLANIMTKCGYIVTREHYVNDAGNQITNMALSVYERYKELFGLEFHLIIMAKKLLRLRK